MIENSVLQVSLHKYFIDPHSTKLRLKTVSNSDEQIIVEIGAVKR